MQNLFFQITKTIFGFFFGLFKFFFIECISSSPFISQSLLTFSTCAPFLRVWFLAVVGVTPRCNRPQILRTSKLPIAALGVTRPPMRTSYHPEMNASPATYPNSVQTFNSLYADFLESDDNLHKKIMHEVAELIYDGQPTDWRQDDSVTGTPTMCHAIGTPFFFFYKKQRWGRELKR